MNRHPVLTLILLTLVLTPLVSGRRPALAQTVRSASVGDFIWLDADADGRQSPGEGGLPGATVSLFLADGRTPARDDTGEVTALIRTNAKGRYVFPDLPPGDYVVRVLPPAGYIVTLLGGADEDDRPDHADNNGRWVENQPYAQTAPVTLEAGELQADLDIGFMPAAEPPTAVEVAVKRQLYFPLFLQLRGDRTR